MKEWIKTKKMNIKHQAKRGGNDIHLIDHKKVGIEYVVTYVGDYDIETSSSFRIISHMLSILLTSLFPLYIVLFVLSTYWTLDCVRVMILEFFFFFLVGWWCHEGNFCHYLIDFYRIYVSDIYEVAGSSWREFYFN